MAARRTAKEPRRPKPRPPRKRRGLPAPEHVVEERELTSPKGRKYQILRTTEHDPYDPVADKDADGESS